MIESHLAVLGHHISSHRNEQSVKETCDQGGDDLQKTFTAEALILYP